MNAICVRKTGGPDVLLLQELPDPIPGEGQVVVRLVPRPRRDWEKQFDGMTARGDDRLLDSKAFSLSNWDEEKWAW